MKGNLFPHIAKRLVATQITMVMYLKETEMQNFFGVSHICMKWYFIDF